MSKFEGSSFLRKYTQGKIANSFYQEQAGETGIVTKHSPGIELPFIAYHYNRETKQTEIHRL